MREAWLGWTLRRALLVSSIASCAVVVSFDEYGRPASRYTVGGQVDGLGGGTVTLAVGEQRLDVGDGPFRFQASLRNGEHWDVALVATPAGRTCSLHAASGTIEAADAGGVIVHCANDARLSNLTISPGTLLPAFDAGTLAYSVTTRTVAQKAPETLTVAATAADPLARVEIQGGLATSGKPAAPVALQSGTTEVGVTVTAADGATTARYSMSVRAGGTYLKPSDTMAGAGFGASVATSGDRIAVGLCSPTAVGSVYVFARSGTSWTQEAHVSASGASHKFGCSVSLTDDTLAVGDPELASVFVFTRAGTAWVQQQMPLGRGEPQSQFGSSIALDGDTLAIGAPGRAAVSIYQRMAGTWLEVAAFEGVNVLGVGPLFGTRVAVDGDVMVASGDGTVRVFVRDDPTSAAWFYLQSLQPSDSTNAWEYGAALSLIADTLVVGAPGIETAYVYVLTGTEWHESTVLHADPPRPRGRFGASIAIATDSIAVASPSDASGSSYGQYDPSDQSAPNAGSVEMFRRSGVTWSRSNDVKANTARTGYRFGSAIALRKDVLVVGSPGDASRATGVNGDDADFFAPGAGAVYVY